MLAALEGDVRTKASIVLSLSIAAFLQFHFVDIHPYGDGNGRLCRVLSKMMLDEVFPVPLPQFRNRQSYIDALERCRSTRTTRPLFDLLLDSAICKYEECCRTQPTQRFFISTDKDAIRAQAKAIFGKCPDVMGDIVRALDGLPVPGYVENATFAIQLLESDDGWVEHKKNLRAQEEKGSPFLRGSVDSVPDTDDL
eukprot:TRINITY_DN16769_c0_g1_i1.p1 TRINITY_DN16769_c0_g1~~TRINITY_DN16769_c0_g1_i1.p1  ORF type:complete len:204 (-),score=26.88 TRINITY_DN16769_c0_g1_i1:93-680(-)